MNKYIDKMPHHVLDKRIEEKHDLIKMVQYVCPICHSEKWKCPYPINHFYMKWDKWQQCLECAHVDDFSKHHKFYYMKDIYMKTR